MDYQSPEYNARRKVYLNEQEQLFDLVVEQQGGDVSDSLGTAIYNLYTQDGLTTAQVAEKIDYWAKGLDPTITHKPVCAVTPEQRVEEALNRAFSHAGHDGAHHKDYAIDQMVRALTGPGYREWVKNFEDGEDGPKTYSWHTGMPA